MHVSDYSGRIESQYKKVKSEMKKEYIIRNYGLSGLKYK